MKFKIVIEETIVQTFYVEADDEDAAIDETIARYKSGDLVLDNAECQYAQMSINESEWFEI